ncbi:hypothetical protein [Olivibacter sitiensis]|uniref:hypothetical protein n=1 Tax=Olivibacter sitiensis TaxID=376470 RepID=UPI0012FB0FD6|nr:hypothetical protein [Olivibacter sitiensis]
MRTLSLEEMESAEGGKVTLCNASGALLSSGAIILAAGIATGGLGFAVAGGLGLYFSAVTGLGCAMS